MLLLKEERIQNSYSQIIDKQHIKLIAIKCYEVFQIAILSVFLWHQLVLYKILVK